jgi:small subunit ribosomal protein S5
VSEERKKLADDLTPEEDQVGLTETDSLEDPKEEEKRDSRKFSKNGEKKSRSRRARSRSKDKEEKEFDEEVLDVARVTRVVKGGRRLRFRVTVVVGDKKGRVGVGTGKSAEVSVSIRKAVSDAKKNLIHVPIVDGTIPHDIFLKFKSAKILMLPAPIGTGVIAGGAFRKVFTLAGVSDVFAKSHGTTCPLVCAQAAILALKSFRKGKRGERKDDVSVVL